MLRPALPMWLPHRQRVDVQRPTCQQRCIDAYTAAAAAAAVAAALCVQRDQNVLQGMTSKRALGVCAYVCVCSCVCVHMCAVPL